jgi:2-amino-4-hydroxy-6-hydroxymethyldihydropteridine diphosphokinase
MTNDPHEARSSTSGREGIAPWPQTVYLGMGSNLGDREANLREAIARIKTLGFEITNASSIYETEPVGYKDQSWFLNQVIAVRVDLERTLNHNFELVGALKGDSTAEAEMSASLKSRAIKEPELASSFWICALLEALLGIERAMGRERTIPDGPRPIDIDILVYGEMECSFVDNCEEPANAGRARRPPFLTLPHPRMHERRFVLEPLCEIAPELMHPTLRKTCGELLASLEDKSEVRPYRKNAK